MTPAGGGPARSRALRTGAALALVLAIGAAARLVSWDGVFTSHGIRLVVDTDPHYHVLRAERLLRGDPDGLWTDRNIDFPAGAPILWPPGFDAAIAASVRALAGPEPTRAGVERVAAFVPVALGVLALAALFALALPWVGAGGALAATLLAAVLPFQVEWGLLGRPDQHVAELLVFAFVLLAFDRAARADGSRRAWAALLGLGLAAAPWTWQGSTLYLAFLAISVAMLHAFRPAGGEDARRATRALALGALVGGALLALSMIAWPPRDALHPVSLAGLSVFHPASLLAVAAWAGLLLAVERLRPGDGAVARAAAAVGCAVLPVALLALSSPGAIRHGLRSLVAVDPWLATISEFQPALLSPRSSFRDDVLWLAWGGPVLLAPVAAIGALRRRWAAAPEARTGLALLVLGTVLFAVLSFALKRFRMYLAPFLLVFAGLWLADLVRRARIEPARRARRAVLAGVAAIAFLAPTGLLHVAAFGSDVSEDEIALLEWLRAREVGRPRRAVLAAWPLGHAIQYYAGLPVVVTPFGTDVGAGGMRDHAAFLFASSLEDAERVLRRRQVGYVLLGSPIVDLENLFGFAPPGAARVTRATSDYFGRGRSIQRLPAADGTVPVWLYESDGVPLVEGRPRGEDALRLVQETPDAHPLKLFEVVEGARVVVSGAPPRATVAVGTDVTTIRGRRFLWWTPAEADATGIVAVRVPYATGWNGATFATPYRIRVGKRILEAVVPESAVARGEEVSVPLDVEGGAGR